LLWPCLEIADIILTQKVRQETDFQQFPCQLLVAMANTCHGKVQCQNILQVHFCGLCPHIFLLKNANGTFGANHDARPR
jgi:hypothetical protein